MIAKLSHTQITCRISTQYQQFFMALDFAGDLHRFGHEIEDLMVNRLAGGRNEQQISRRRIFLTYEEHWRNAAAEAADHRDRAGVPARD
jgi:hypothetical protein